MRRRDVLKVLLAAPAATFAWTDAEAAQAAASAQVARAATAAKPFVPKFFTATEFRLVRVLADIVIPKDDRSGSATDAGVPEFMDFMMIDQPARQVAMRGGLAWLDVECQKRFDKTFLNCAEAERTAVLDDIAWPARAQPEFAHGVAFFSNFRDLTASGFWTTRSRVK
jgi:gluconate 2-dehydrogenase gamma chain